MINYIYAILYLIKFPLYRILFVKTEKIPIKNFNIFYTNINGLENKFDLLYEFLSNSDSDFDIIGITETSQKSNEMFTSNVSISSYNMYSTSSLSSKGGISIYVEVHLHNFERNDLKIQHNEFEAVWIEIINKVIN